VRQLRHHLKLISRYMEELEDSRHQIRLEMGSTEVTLNSLSGKVPRETKNSVLRVLKIVQGVDANTANRDEFYEVLAELNKIIEELKHLQADFEAEI
jgi:hypothetical protein